MAMRVSYRQAKRPQRAYRERGDAGIIHGNSGRASNNRLSEGILEAALAAYRGKYPDFGPTLAAEKMAENDGIRVGVGTLRNPFIKPSRN